MGLAGMLRREISGLIDILLPPACPLCGHGLDSGKDPGLCAGCLAGFHPLAPPSCPRCALPFATEGGDDHLCESCLRHPPEFAWVKALGLYESCLRQAVGDFKYRTAVDLDRPLGRLMGASLAGDIERFAPHLLVPVPLHPSRLRERTYNQSLLLARRLCRLWKIPIDSENLRRIRPTAPQQGLSAKDRQNNLRGAFGLRMPLAGKRVLLVDDVMTTGATVRECSRVLRKGGASAVGVVVLARAGRYLL